MANERNENGQSGQRIIARTTLAQLVTKVRENSTQIDFEEGIQKEATQRIWNTSETLSKEEEQALERAYRDSQRRASVLRAERSHLVNRAMEVIIHLVETAPAELKAEINDYYVKTVVDVVFRF